MYCVKGEVKKLCMEVKAGTSADVSIRSLRQFDLASNGVAPPGVAGEDGEWKSAKLLNVARGGYVTGVELVVKSADVPVPVKVRYLVRPRTMGTVYNQMSLPLGPFSADVSGGAFADDPPCTAAEDPERPLKVLMIGNSFSI